jgi:hypothetical protein
VIDISKAWLDAVPWESVQTLNQALCHAQKAQYATNAKSFASVGVRWQNAVPRTSGLVEVLDLIRECREALPFTLNNGNTFAAIAKTLVDDWIKSLAPIEAQIVRTTVCHYVAGQVGRKELLQVLQHLGPACKHPAPAPVKSEPAPVGQVQAQGAV